MSWLHKSIGIALVVVLVSLVGWLAYQQFTKGSTNHDAPSPATSTVASQPTLSETDAQRLEAALNSGDKAQQAEVLTDEFGKTFLASGQSLGDATVRIKPETFTSNGTFAQVAATANSSVEQEFILSLEYQDNQWKIFLIEPKR